MPCYQINLVSVEFRVDNLEYLKKVIGQNSAFMSLNQITTDSDSIKIYGRTGYFSLNLKTHQALSTMSSDEFNFIKREYSKVAVEEIAKKMKWVLKRKADNKFQVKQY